MAEQEPMEASKRHRFKLVRDLKWIQRTLHWKEVYAELPDIHKFTDAKKAPVLG